MLILRSALLVPCAVITIHAAAQEGGDRWKDKIGQRVTVRGEAHNAKLGALVEVDGSIIWVDLPGNAWPDGVYHGLDEGEQVEVTGTVVQRKDVPVFVPEPGEPIRQGVTVAPGMDLDEASKRYILEAVEWKLVETVPQQQSR